MSGSPWFYFPFQASSSGSIEITGPEIRHITGARRLRLGDKITLMNGQGGLASCVLASIDPRGKRLVLQIDSVKKAPPFDKQIVLASAIPKGDRLSTMLDMATQLGVTRFQPVKFERSVTKWSNHTQARCTRIVIEAAKQSKRAWAPVVEQEISYKSLLNDYMNSGHIVILADQFGRELDRLGKNLQEADQIVMLIGPEGGLSDREKGLSQENNIITVSLAAPILRIETAAVAAISALNQIR